MCRKEKTDVAKLRTSEEVHDCGCSKGNKIAVFHVSSQDHAMWTNDIFQVLATSVESLLKNHNTKSTFLTQYIHRRNPKSTQSLLNLIRHHVAGGSHLQPIGSDRRKSPAVAHPSAEQQHSNNNNSVYRRRTASSSSSSSSSSRPSSPNRAAHRENAVHLWSSESDLHLPFWKRTRAMALLLFGIAIFLFLALDSHYVTSTVVATTSQGVEVSYGSVIKLMHEKTKFRLHSHSMPYGSGSGQQSVTCFPRVDDANSYWIVRPELETSVKQGDSIKSGTVIRLQHLRTRKWLHSHLHASPISGNLEVSCFGDDGNSDTGDHWRLEIEGGGKSWKQDQKFRLRHVETSGYLHSHDKKYNGVAGGQQEVCGVKEKRGTNIWLAAEGIFFTTAEKKSSIV